MDFGTYDHAGLVLGGIGIFFLIRLAIGYYASRKVETATDYVVAGRRLPIWLAGASIMATWFAAETLMGASASAYQWGFQGVVFDPFGAVLCLALSGFLFIRLMRRARYLTAMDFFEQRYGKALTLLGSAAQLIAYFGWTAAQIVAGGTIVHMLLGWPAAVGMIVVATVVTVYTTMGGLWADTLLDFMQMFFSAGGITLIFIAVVRALGGWQGFITGAGAQFVSKPFNILPLQGEGYLGYTGHMGWFYWLAAWMAVGLGSLPAQDLMQRSMSGRNEAVAVHGTYLAGILYGVFGILSPLIGLGMFALNPDIAPENAEFLLLTAATDFLPPLLTAVFVAALASALMSTSDSSILAGASLVTENILPYFRDNLDERTRLRWTRWMVVAIGAISLLVALFAATIYKLAIFAWSILLVGLVAPFVLGMYWKKANHTGALAGFFGGFASWLVALAAYYPATLAACAGDVETALWDAAYIGSTPAFLFSVVAMIVVSLLTQRRDPPRSIVDVEGAPLPRRNLLGLLPVRQAFERQEEA
ncbi:MAG: sodium:solute symporter family protein [Anaerolineae bacterium]|nr:sodium:solute symporter family protein [Anaerolineae bacterium]